MHSFPRTPTNTLEPLEPLSRGLGDVSHPQDESTRPQASWVFFPGRDGQPKPISDAGPYTATDNEESCTALWSIYVGEAEKYDTALVQSWKADMEGMLIFSGLFSASLTAFIIESYKTLQPDPGDLTVAAISQLSKQLTAMAAGGSLPEQTPSPFQPAVTSLVCNSLWFVSLALSLICALLATLVEQWAREFLHKTDMRPSPTRRARVFSFLYFGLKRFRMHALVNAIPFLLHSSLLLFFAGLVVFLIPVNRIIVYIMAGASFVFAVLYVVLTGLPVVYLDCPYHTPLSAPLWSLLLKIRGVFSRGRTADTAKTMTACVLERAMEEPDDRDQRTLWWTLQSLTDDTELLPFVETIPDVIYGAKGFRKSKDALFIPLLGDLETPSPLVTRICNLIAGADDLRLDDPLRARRQAAGFKALWALAMIPVSSQKRFDTSSIEAFFRDVGSDPLRNTTLLALQYQKVQWIRHVVFTLRNTLQIWHVQAAYSKQKTIPTIERLVNFVLELEAPGILPHDALGPLDPILLQRLRMGLASGSLAHTKIAVNSLVELVDWTTLHVGIVISFLKRALALPNVDPFEPLATCSQIIGKLDFGSSENPLVPWSFSDFHFKNLTQVLESHALEMESVVVHKVDILMRIAFRLLPFSSTSTIRSYVNYLYHRTSKDAVLYAVQDCDMRILSRAFCHQLGRYSRSGLYQNPLWTRLSHAIVVLIGVYSPLSHASRFADDVLAIVNEDTADRTVSPSNFTAIVHAVKTLRGLEELAIEIGSLLSRFALLQPRRDMFAEAQVRKLCQHELLRPHCPLFLPEGTNLAIAGESIQAEIFNQYLRSLASLLHHSILQPWIAHPAVIAFDLFATVGCAKTVIWKRLSPEAQDQFCGAVLRFVEHLAKNFTNMDVDRRLVRLAEAMWRSPIFWRVDEGGPIVNPNLCDWEASAVDALIEALLLYKRFATEASIGTAVSDAVLSWITDPVVTASAKTRRDS